MENTIYSINGPVVTIKGKTDLEMMEMVYVGKARLVGEVIRMNDRETTIQVYEETGGLKAGACREHGRPAVRDPRPRHPAQYL
jgi:V/A-type H+-transporting ATPase subunit A